MPLIGPMSHEISIFSQNVRGLRGAEKRRQLFYKFHSSKHQLFFLQETHSTQQIESQWSSEWGGKIYFSHGTSESRGVCILIKNSISIDVHNTVALPTGRLLLLDATINNSRVTLCNVYAPNEDDSDFFLDLTSKIEQIGNSYQILGGDFNLVLDLNKDKKGGRLQTHENSRQLLLAWMEDNDLVDIYRLQHPDTLMYTWNRRQPTLISCRLDFFIISFALVDKVCSTNILPGYKSDHSGIDLNIQFISNKRGPGFWKFNASLLTEINYVHLIKNTIATANLDLLDTNPSLKWETLKTIIRGVTIQYSSRKKNNTKAKLNELEGKISELQSKLATDPSNNLLQLSVDQLNDEYSNLISEKTKGVMIRSRARWVEFGEKSSKYFLNLEKRNYNNKTIDVLQLDNGNQITDPDRILVEEKLFYENLYSSEILQSNEEASNEFFPGENVRLTEEQKNNTDQNITEHDLLTALKSMPSNKSPGSDGFTSEFFKFFWTDIKDLFFKAVKYYYEQKELGISQRLGLISLLPKKDKNPLLLRNWRPLSLLNVDYKLIAKVVATKIKLCLPSIIHSDQNAYVKGRYIGENLVKILSIIELLNDEDIPALLISVDFEKAFDRVEWSFIDKCLSYFNFGECVRTWVKILYTGVQSCVMNNGWASERFSITRGVRQGCPLSPYLFTLCVEILAIYVRNNQNIKGINIGGFEHKFSHFADDTNLTVLFCPDTLSEIINTFDKYQTISGLKVNYDKTEILRIGSIRKTNAKLYSQKPLHWSDGPITILGIEFSTDIEEIFKSNYKKVIIKMENLVKLWRMRDLTLYGKNTVLKSLIISQLIYVSSVLPFPATQDMEKIKELFNKFLWDGKRSKIAHNVLINEYDKGGIKLLDIESHLNAIKTSWVKRFSYLIEMPSWHSLLKSCSSYDMIPFLKGNVSPKDFKKLIQVKSKIIFDILLAWSRLNFKEPQDTQSIVSQPLWFNSFIKIDKKLVHYKLFENAGVCTVQDLLDNTGSFLSYMAFKRQYNLMNVNMIQYFGLIHAIPQSWKQILSDEFEHFAIIEPLYSKFIKLMKPSKFAYEMLIKDKCDTSFPKITKWKDDINYVGETYSTELCFSLIYSTTLDPKLRFFQYRLLNRTITTNYILHKWNLVETNICSFCSNYPETLNHLFLQCPNTRNIWNDFEHWWFQNSNTQLSLTNFEIIFGFCTKSPLDTLKNTLILVTKQYIYSCRCRGLVPFIDSLINRFSQTYKIEKIIALNKNKLHFHNNKWQLIADSL